VVLAKLQRDVAAPWRIVLSSFSMEDMAEASTPKGANKLGNRSGSRDGVVCACGAEMSTQRDSYSSVPFQFNWYQAVGPLELSTFILNVQPVIPLQLNDHWNLILRIIVPFIGQPPLFDGDVSTFGVGDMTTSFFFSPRNNSGFTWGVGPVFDTPSSYQPEIGSGRYSIGPTGVALQQTGKWTIGALVNQVWSVAGDRRRADVNQIFLQPFIAYQANRTVTLTVNSETTGNWEAHGGDRWTVPILGQIGKLNKFGPFPASYQLGLAWFAAHPDLGPTWSIRAAVILLLPEKK
jgi:hypothetical protein